MSLDMRDYSGELDPAAVDNQALDSNSYLQEAQDALLGSSVTPEVETPKEANPQAEHFRALREEVDRMRTERDTEKRDYQAQLDMLRVNMAQKSDAAPERRFLDGLKDDDVPSVAELRKEMEQRESNYQSRIEELQVAQSHPDYAEVIEKFALPLVKLKPHLAEGLQGARNKALFAYELGKMAQAMQQQNIPAPVVSETAQRIVENSKKPGTLSQGGGQGALSKADYIANMSDEEFYKYASKNLDKI